MPLRTEAAGETPDTIDGLFLRYQRPILVHLARLVGDYATAEDLCQETFARALRGWPAGAPPANGAAWLYRIATNAAYDHLRRRRRIHFAPLQAADGAPSRDRTADEERDRVRAALADVPERYRVPLVLHACEGYSMEEIADRLGCSSAAVKMRLFRGRARFRAAYTRFSPHP
ncbi:MAG TPA: RNA polymerase sigma factor [Roseiflexaceae bacterium]|nr:RNA polymerase sigma factor [Roseiflexaceae bacterium]